MANIKLPNERLSVIRDGSHLSFAELSERCSLSVEHLRDLEAYPNDIFMTVSLDQLEQLCTALGCPIRAVFAESDCSPLVREEFNLRPLAERLEQFLGSQGISLAEFENKCGWQISGFLTNPELGKSWNLDCLRDISNALNSNWLTYLSEKK